jgi:hypothetical protein
MRSIGFGLCLAIGVMTAAVLVPLGGPSGAARATALHPEETTSTFQVPKLAEPDRVCGCLPEPEQIVGARLWRVDGVLRVDIDAAEARIIVVHDASRASASSIRQALAEIGFPSE